MPIRNLELVTAINQYQKRLKHFLTIHGQPWKMKSRHSLCDEDVLV